MFPAVQSSILATVAAAATYYLFGWYSDRVNEIIPGAVWLGNIAEAWAPGNYTHIVCATQFGTAAAFYPDRFVYETVAVQDDAAADIESAFDRVASFIDQAVQAKGRVLVHCNQGRSRSVALLCAYLMRYRQMTLARALQTIRCHRPIAQPNEGFMRQLERYERSIHGQET